MYTGRIPIHRWRSSWSPCFSLLVTASDFSPSLRSKSVEIAMPSFIPVTDGSMALERMLNLADVHAECKRQGTIKQVDQEREELVCSSEAFVAAMSSIRGLSPHDANTLQQGIGSIEEIVAANKEEIMDSTDLSAEKADAIVKLFHDVKYYMTPVPNQ